MHTAHICFLMLAIRPVRPSCYSAQVVFGRRRPHGLLGPSDDRKAGEPHALTDHAEVLVRRS
jgi:hypothetical protein